MIHAFLVRHTLRGVEHRLPGLPVRHTRQHDTPSTSPASHHGGHATVAVAGAGTGTPAQCTATCSHCLAIAHEQLCALETLSRAVRR